MKLNRRHVLAATVGVAVIGTFAAVALGAAPFQQVLVTADFNETVHLNSDRIKFQTKDPTDVRVQKFTFESGDRTGWHHHPGFVLIAVQSGELTLVDSHCNSKTYGPLSPNGSAFVEYGDDPVQVRNMGAAQATSYVTFVVPSADPPAFATGDDPPPCP